MRIITFTNKDFVEILPRISLSYGIGEKSNYVLSLGWIFWEVDIFFEDV
jgi:hypothetical protein